MATCQCIAAAYWPLQSLMFVLLDGADGLAIQYLRSHVLQALCRGTFVESNSSCSLCFQNSVAFC